MFDNLKKLAELKKMQDSFKKERATTEKNGVSITINGNLDIEDIKLNPELGIEEQQKVLKDCLNDAKQSMQKKLAQNLMGSGFGL